MLVELIQSLLTHQAVFEQTANSRQVESSSCMLLPHSVRLPTPTDSNVQRSHTWIIGSISLATNTLNPYYIVLSSRILGAVKY